MSRTPAKLSSWPPPTCGRSITASHTISAAGVRTTIGTFAQHIRTQFHIAEEPQFTMPSRLWDVPQWFASPGKAEADLGWIARTSLAEGLRGTSHWLASLREHGKIREIVQVFRRRRDFQRLGHHRLLQGRGGHPVHVPASEACLRDVEHRSRDHLRQRLLAGREPGGHQGPLGEGSARHRDLAFPELRLAGGLSQRHGSGDQERLHPPRRRPAGSAGAHRGVRGQVATGLRRRVRTPCQARTRRS